MPEWTTKQRYMPYASYSQEYQTQLIQAQRTSQYHLCYHIQPESGLLNDPNGFSFFNGKWQLFYQNFPYGAVHGLKSWQHVTSSDLTHWSAPSLALQPHAPYTTNGVYSGSALPIGDRLFLMYTGNVRGEDGTRKSTQLGAWMAADGTITELDQPLIAEPPAGYTAHFRDPQIVHVDDQYYAVIGAQRQDLVGEILVYQAPQPEGPWSLIGPLDWQQGDLGYMMECPNIAFVDGKVVILFCPQGLARSRFNYQNIYPNTYVIADAIDWTSGRLVNPGQLQTVDAGFDSYATQVVNGPDAQAYAVSWMGLPEIGYPTDAEGWQGCLSLIKRLTIKDNQLYQEPIVQSLLGNHFEPLHDTLKLQEVLRFDLETDTTGEIRLGNADEALQLNWTADTLTVDRTQAGIAFGETYGTTRTITWSKGSHQLELYLDHSTFELFVDGGQQVLSGRIFPRQKQAWTVSAPEQVRVTGQRLKTM
ncbi:sucrose-6-phosphate hydrolase [Lacticaseibacillus saniviri]